MILSLLFATPRSEEKGRKDLKMKRKIENFTKLKIQSELKTGSDRQRETVHKILSQYGTEQCNQVQYSEEYYVRA